MSEVDSVSFTVTIHRKFAKDGDELPPRESARMDLAGALNWICDELPPEAWDVDYVGERPDGTADKVTISIDWSKVPDAIKFPPAVPASRELKRQRDRVTP